MILDNDEKELANENETNGVEIYYKKTKYPSVAGRDPHVQEHKM